MSGRAGAGGRDDRIRSSRVRPPQTERLVRFVRQQRGPMAQSKVVKQVLTPPPPSPRLAREEGPFEKWSSLAKSQAIDPLEKRQPV